MIFIYDNAIITFYAILKIKRIDAIKEETEIFNK